MIFSMKYLFSIALLLLFALGCKPEEPIDPEPDPNPIDTTSKETSPGLKAFSLVPVNPRLPGNFYDVMGLPNGDMLAYTPFGVQLSQDGGNNWQTTLSGTLNLGWALAPNGDVYLAVKAQGLYRSQNNGQSWTLLTTSGYDWNAAYNGFQLAIPADGDIFLLASGHFTEPAALFHSTDGQAFTQKTLPPSNQLVIEVKAATDNGLLALRIDGLYRSEDDGTSWQKILDQVNLQRLQVEADGTCYLSSGTAIWRGPDDSPTGWQFTGANGWMSGRLYNGSIAARLVNKGIFWSNDQGKSWWPMGSMVGFPSKMVSTTKGTVVVNDLSQLNYLNTDDWSWYIRYWPSGEVRAFVQEEGRWILALRNQLFISRDQGQTWYGRYLFDGYAIQAMTAKPGGNIFVSLGGTLHTLDPDAVGILRTTYAPSGNQYNWFTALAYDPNGILYAAYGEDDPGFAGRSGYLFFSTDEGQNWQYTFPYGNVTDNSYITLMRVTNYGLSTWFSDYQGNSWTSQAIPWQWNWNRLAVSTGFPSNKKIVGNGGFTIGNQGLELNLTNDAWLHYGRRKTGVLTTESVQLPTVGSAAYGMVVQGDRKLRVWGEGGMFVSSAPLELE